MLRYKIDDNNSVVLQKINYVSLKATNKQNRMHDYS